MPHDKSDRRLVALDKAVEEGEIQNVEAMRKYARGTWPKFILNHIVYTGKKWGKGLSLLKGFGGAQTMPIWAEALMVTGALAIMIYHTVFC